MSRSSCALVAALVVGAALRVAWTLAFDTQPVSDFLWYYERGIAISEGSGYSIEGRPTAFWPVGYSGFLGAFFAVFGPSVELARWLNTLLGVATVALTFWLTLKLCGGKPWPAVVACWIVAIHPSQVAYGSILASEPLFSATSLLGCLWLTRARESWKWVALAGLAFGAATLVRPQAILMPGLAALCLWLWDMRESRPERPLACLAALTVGFALVVGPWVIRNTVLFERPTFVSTNGGYNLLIGNNPFATGRYMPPEQTGFVPEAGTEAEEDRARGRYAAGYLRRHFPAMVRLWPEKLRQSFVVSTDATYWGFQDRYGQLIEPGRDRHKPAYLWLRDAGAAFQLSLLVLAGIGAALIWKPPFALPKAVVLTTAALALLFFGNPRFGFPTTPFLAMLACAPLLAINPPAKRAGGTESV